MIVLVWLVLIVPTWVFPGPWEHILFFGIGYCIGIRMEGYVTQDDTRNGSDSRGCVLLESNTNVNHWLMHRITDELLERAVFPFMCAGSEMSSDEGLRRSSLESRRRRDRRQWRISNCLPLHYNDPLDPCRFFVGNANL